MSRKAQGLSLNAIIIAVIVLVVLIIIVAMTTGYFSVWRGKFSNVSDTNCKGQGGEEKVSCDPTAEREIYSAQVSSGKTCCAQKSCEEIGGSCCTGGTVIRNNDPSCKAINPLAPNCCQSS